ncbi:MAG: DUF488 domain-containing protein [Deltaproteobacteria bacterium]|jgi:hypothetical protein|nr:DUF488 domain-containing protein [Deltaproteobacteria bacterium]
MTQTQNQPTFARQRFLLEFVRQFNDGVAESDLQILAFLYLTRDNFRSYAFIPRFYAPYSFQLANDLEILRAKGFLSIDSVSGERRVQATGGPSRERLFEIDAERGQDLIRKACRRQAWSALNRDFVADLARGAKFDKIRRVKRELGKTEQVLFTIGYEGKSVDEFINALILNDVRLLIDVRRNPRSRKFGFSRDKIRIFIETVGIGYAHLPELGVESDKRRSLKTPEDRQALLSDYKNSLQNNDESLKNIYELLKDNGRVALACYELNPEMCHRSVIHDSLVCARNIKSQDL